MSENDVWGQEQFDYSEDITVVTGVKVNGTVIPVEVGDSFRERIKNISLDAGFGKYRVFLNGAEIKPSEAPSVFAEGDVAEVRAYDDAGKK